MILGSLSKLYVHVSCEFWWCLSKPVVSCDSVSRPLWQCSNTGPMFRHWSDALTVTQCLGISPMLKQWLMNVIVARSLFVYMSTFDMYISHVVHTVYIPKLAVKYSEMSSLLFANDLAVLSYAM